MFKQAFANIATGFSGMAGGPFVDAVAVWQGDPVIDAGGSITTPGAPSEYPCKAQVDSPSQTMRGDEGFLETDLRIIVLSASISRVLDTEAKVNVLSGPHAGLYALKTCGGDSVDIGYECRARKVVKNAD